MHTSRDMYSGENLDLSDQDLRDQQVNMRARSHNNFSKTASEKVEAGDTVTPLTKHRAEDPSSPLQGPHQATEQG